MRYLEIGWPDQNLGFGGKYCLVYIRYLRLFGAFAIFPVFDNLVSGQKDPNLGLG